MVSRFDWIGQRRGLDGSANVTSTVTVFVSREDCIDHQRGLCWLADETGLVSRWDSIGQQGTGLASIWDCIDQQMGLTWSVDVTVLT